MDKETLLKEFIEANPELVQLNPEIKIRETTEVYETGKEPIFYDPPLIQIEIRRPFIFDMRLIPEEFNGIEVIDYIMSYDTTSLYPKEFPSEYSSLPFEEFLAPEFFVKFVENNLPMIANKLKIPNLTKAEALDALTGNFEKHIKKCIENRTKRIQIEKENIAFFYELLYETSQYYYLSDVYEKYEDKDWNYSVTATMITKNKPLIVGFNWGAEAGYKYSPQCEYPFHDFEGLYDDLGSLKRTIPYFHEYYTKALYGMQTNFCFFRSQKEDQISYRDLELCKPLFDKYLDYAKPSVIISFSSKLRNYFIDNNLITDKKSLFIKYLKGKTEIVRAKYKTNSGKVIDFVYIPHPNAHISTEERVKAWDFCFYDNEIRQ